MEEKVTRQKKGFRRQAVRWSIVPNWENPQAGFLQSKKKKKAKSWESLFVFSTDI